MNEGRASLAERTRARRLRGLLVAVLALEAAAIALGLAGALPSPLALWRPVLDLVCVALAGSFVLALGARPPRRALLATVLAGLLLGAAAIVADLPASPLGCLGGGLGLAALGLLAALSLRAPPGERRRLVPVLHAALLLPAWILLLVTALWATVRLHPATFDGALYLADSGFGLQPSFATARLLERLPSLALAANAIYWLLPLAIAAVPALAFASARPAPVGTAVAFAATGVAGYALYHLLPAIGPVFLVAGFPDRLPSLPIPAVLGSGAPRNCMPSLHAAWALLALRQARPFGPLARVGAACFLGFTLLATLGFGYHYLVDLVVAAPFVTAVQAACLAPRGAAERRERRLAIALGSSLTLAWIAL